MGNFFDQFDAPAGPAAAPAGGAASGGAPAMPQFGMPAGGPAASGGIMRVPGGGIVAMPYNNAEGAYLTDLAGEQVKFRREAINNAKEAQRADASLQQFKTAVAEAKAKGTEPGYFTPALGQLAAGAKSLGIDLSPLGLPKPDAVGDIQTANKVSKAIFGEVLKKMFPQRITNADMKVNEGIAPGMGLDERANENLVNAIAAQNEYDKNLAASMLDYEGKNRGLFGFEREHYSKNGYGPQLFIYSKSAPASGVGAGGAEQGGAALPEGIPAGSVPAGTEKGTNKPVWKTPQGKFLTVD